MATEALKAWQKKLSPTYTALPENEKLLLHQWLADFVDSSSQNDPSDWPGWEPYIGKKPTTAQ